ncbi:MAG: TonB family protein [Saprospiraceae bacterium]|nr:TonB family protein [Saprospiraceae bacterium]
MKKIALLYCLFSFFFNEKNTAQAQPQLHAQGRFVGYKDSTGQWLVPPQFISIEEPYSNRMVVQDGTKNYGLINGKGEFIIRCEYQQLEKQKMRDSTRLFLGGYLASKNGLWGLVDTLGQAIVPVEFETGKWLNKSTLYFYRRGRQLALDDKGKTLFEGDYQYAEMNSAPQLNTWYFVAMKDDKMGLIDWDHNIVLPFEHEAVVVWPGNRVQCRHYGGRYSMTDMQGKEILPARFKYLKFAGYGFVMATDFETGKSGFVDTAGTVRLPLDFADCGLVSNGVLGSGHYFKAAKTKEMALFDPAGKQMTDFLYKDLTCSSYAPTLFFAQRPDKKFILLDTLGKPLPAPPVDGLSAQFTAIGVRNGKLHGLFTSDGRRVTDIKYDAAYGMVSKAEIAQLTAEHDLQPPVTVIGHATLGNQKFFITSDGRELPPPSKPKQDAKPSEALDGKMNGDEPIPTPEIAPEFPGGESAKLAFITNNLRYPVMAKENGVQGMAVVQFVVERDGSITNVQLARDLGNGCGQEALRLVQKMPKWTPGRDKGQPVRVLVTLPVRFKLEGN